MEPTIFTPEPYRMYGGETLVQVISPAGQRCGEFPWPTDSLWLLALCNGSKWGYHFAYNEGITILQPTMANPKITGIDSLKPNN